MRYHLVLFFFILSICGITNVYSQETTDNIKHQDSIKLSNGMSLWETLKYDGSSTFGGIKHTYTRPFKWKGKDWAKFGGIVAGTALIYLVDEPANDYFKEQSKDIPHFLQEFGFRFGKPVINYGLTTGIYAFGLFAKNEKVRKTGVLLIASATAGGIIQTLSKTLVGRARPTTNEGNGSFRFYNHEAAYHSFPSGHTILSFTTAYAISKQFKNPFVKGGINAIGLISPVSRLWSGAHWLTDVSLGIVLSVVVVDTIDNYLNKNERYISYKNPNKLHIKWNLKIGAGQLGLVGTF